MSTQTPQQKINCLEVNCRNLRIALVDLVAKSQEVRPFRAFANKKLRSEWMESMDIATDVLGDIHDSGGIEE